MEVQTTMSVRAHQNLFLGQALRETATEQGFGWPVLWGCWFLPYPLLSLPCISLPQFAPLLHFQRISHEWCWWYGNCHGDFCGLAKPLGRCVLPSTIPKLQKKLDLRGQRKLELPNSMVPEIAEIV